MKLVRHPVPFLSENNYNPFVNFYVLVPIMLIDVKEEALKGRAEQFPLT
jgi:hypothetical protein